MEFTSNIMKLIPKIQEKLANGVRDVIGDFYIHPKEYLTLELDDSINDFFVEGNEAADWNMYLTVKFLVERIQDTQG